MTETAEVETVAADAAARPDGTLWHRVAEVVGVSYPKRTLDLVVIPYEVETLVPYSGRMVFESIARGAFDGIERRANRIRVNRDHVMERTVGRAVALHPSRENGLVGEVRIAQTPLGDETLALAEDGCLDASAAFLPMKDGLAWLARNRYVVQRAWLGHIALTPDPAYEDAKVLSVRSRDDEQPTSQTPNLDEWRAIRRDDALPSQLL